MNTPVLFNFSDSHIKNTIQKEKTIILLFSGESVVFFFLALLLFFVEGIILNIIFNLFFIVGILLFFKKVPEKKLERNFRKKIWNLINKISIQESFVTNQKKSFSEEDEVILAESREEMQKKKELYSLCIRQIKQEKNQELDE